MVKQSYVNGHWLIDTVAKPYYDIYRAKYTRYIRAQQAFIANAKPETLKSLHHLRKLISANRRNDFNVANGFLL